VPLAVEHVDLPVVEVSRVQERIPGVGCAIARPLKTAPGSTDTGATCASGPPRQPRIAPLSVSKMNAAGPSVGSVSVGTRKLPGTPAKTTPVGLVGTLTTNGGDGGGGKGVPAKLYSVDTLGSLSDTHHGLVGPRASPHALTRFGSVVAARPGMSDTSGVTANVPPGGAAPTDAAAVSPSERTAAANKLRRMNRRISHPPPVGFRGHTLTGTERFAASPPAQALRELSTNLRNLAPAAIEAWCSEMQRGVVSPGTFWILRPKQRPYGVAMASYW
jgi:hypothetical protein